MNPERKALMLSLGRRNEVALEERVERLELELAKTLAALDSVLLYLAELREGGHLPQIQDADW
ncbi:MULTISPECIES: hypothetical protein [unclassified Methylococcus]|uniref:hypothetical protein n=1 Tax=unclassified Methylococcus TaxID=2618889 RepID=UPI003D7C7F6E